MKTISIVSLIVVAALAGVSPVYAPEEPYIRVAPAAACPAEGMVVYWGVAIDGVKTSPLTNIVLSSDPGGLIGDYECMLPVNATLNSGEIPICKVLISESASCGHYTVAVTWTETVGDTVYSAPLGSAPFDVDGPCCQPANPHDLDVALPSGAHIYVDYDSAYTADEKRVTNGNLTRYLPLVSSEFWTIYHDAFVTMKRSEGNTASGAIDYDGAGNIVSYRGEVNIYTGLPPVSADFYVQVLLHEWTHLFQFWIPNYVNRIGPHVEGIADAFSSALVLEDLGWDTSEYSGSLLNTMGQLVSGSSYGLATYLRATALGGHLLRQGWEGLWYHDHQTFKKFNALMASLPSDSPVSFREVVRRSLFEGYVDYAYDGLSVDDWLDAFSFYNSISDVPEGSKMIQWESSPTAVFEGMVFVNSGTQASVILFSSYDIAIYDAQTHELLHSKTGESAFCSLGFCGIVVLNNSTFPMRDLLRIDAVAHLSGGDLPVVAYVAARHNDHGDRVIFFLNRDGYAEGSGSSSVGTLQNGLVRWTSGDNVEATVTWSGGTYTYVIENVMAHPAMRMHQIAVPLYKSRTRLSPLAQIMNSGSPAQFTVRLSPKVSTGTVTIYHSTDQMNWTTAASDAPADGLANFSLAFSEAGTHYLKAVWSGDGTVESSESSIVRLEITGTTTTIQTTWSSVTTNTTTQQTTTQSTATSIISAEIGHVVISEVEQNPQGDNSNLEWVLLYNPTEANVDISGWRIQTTHGRSKTYAIPLGIVIPAGGYWNITLPGQIIDDEDESLMLMNAQGQVIDSTPTLTDTADDSNTWQRVPDGSDNWVYAPEFPRPIILMIALTFVLIAMQRREVIKSRRKSS